MKKHRPFLFASVLGAGLLMAASAAVNPANNTDFGADKTNLWLVIQLTNTNGEIANTINSKMEEAPTIAG